MIRHFRRQKKLIISGIAALLIAALAWLSFGPQSGDIVLMDPNQDSSASSSASGKHVTVGVAGLSSATQQVWAAVSKIARNRYGITVSIKNFTDYNQPNQALQNGDIDLNAYQHYAFLNAWNKANHADLVGIGTTVIAPIRLYSRQYSSVQDIPRGSTIAVPNDATNESRALLTLQHAGLISVRLPKNGLATVASITDNPKKLTIKEVPPDQTPRVLESVAGSVINDDFAASSNTPLSLAIATEPVDASSHQWLNIIAARKKDAHNDLFAKVVECYQSDEIATVIRRAYGGRTLPAFGEYLKRLEDQHAE